MTTSGGPNYRIQDIHGSIGCGSELDIISPPTRRSLRRSPHHVPQGKNHRWRSGSAFSVNVMEYWNKLPASVGKGPSVNIFEKRSDQVWTIVFQHLPVY